VREAWLVVGLGNPGPEYASTRHNVGFMGVDDLAVRCAIRLARHKRANAHVGEGHLAGGRIVLAEPMTFMNESGGPVKALLAFYDIPVERMVVLHDELDIKFDTLRVKLGGGDNGHNGLKSLRKALGTGDFYRVRIGIGRPPGRQDPADFVLTTFAATERTLVPSLASRAADAVESLLTDGLEVTQSRFT
jgi:PTH1 family peptidyl-tRNA hydrolase